MGSSPTSSGFFEHIIQTLSAAMAAPKTSSVPTKGVANSANTAATTPKAAPTPPNPYSLSGSFDADVSRFMAQAQNAQASLNQYIVNSPKILSINGSVVVSTEVDDNGNPIPDQAATKLLQQYNATQDSLDTLYANKKAGLYGVTGGSGGGGGGDAAAAYMQSETAAAAEAKRAYDDYVQRISDAAAVEGIPRKAASDTASTLASIASTKKNLTSPYESRQFYRPPAPAMDYGAAAKSIGSTVAASAPAFRPITPAPAGLSSGVSNPAVGTQLPTPQQVLDKYGYHTPILSPVQNQSQLVYIDPNVPGAGTPANPGQG